MLRTEKQLTFSNYPGLYDVVVPADHSLRKIKEEIDFSFVNALLEDSYCKNFGRPAKEPEMLFKFLFLKHMYALSDEKVTDQASYNMAFKYFLDLHPEDPIIHSSLLTKFRKNRMTEALLEKMLAETVRQAMEKGLIESKAIILDSTHSHSKGKAETPTEKLKKMSKALRRTIYQHQKELAEVFPEKPKADCSLEEEIAYCKSLLFSLDEKVEHERVKKRFEKVKRQLEKVGVLETNGEQVEGTEDTTEATVGHKSQDEAFFGFKNHIAINDERLITGLTVTTGRHGDTDQLEALAKQSMSNGQPVEEILGDTAYPSLDNLIYCETNGIKLIANLHPIISDGMPKDPEFSFNKDSGMLQCPEGHLALSCQPSIVKRKTKKGEHESLCYKYYFSIKKCKKCPRNGTCYNGGNYKYCSITVRSETHKKQSEFEKSEYFQTRRCDRYKIEAKNAELKQSHGLARCSYTGLVGMKLQSYFVAFVANAKRIVKLQEIKKGGDGKDSCLLTIRDAVKAGLETVFILQTA